MATSRSFKVRFWSHVLKAGPGECWNWQGHLRADGYGLYNGKRAHRIAFSLCGASVPRGSLVCHTCDNRRCVNPRHLFVGSHLDNMRDAKRKSRLSRGSTRSPLLAEQIVELRRRHAQGETQRALAVEFGVSQSAVGRIVLGVTWNWLRKGPLRAKGSSGEAAHNALFTEKQVVRMRVLRSHGWTLQRLAAKFKTDFRTVSLITTGRRWKAAGGPTVKRYGGAANYNAKLSEMDVREIRRMAGHMTRSAIAIKFGLSVGYVSMLVRKLRR